MDRQRNLQLLNDTDSIVAELQDNWEEYADDDGVLSIVVCVREHKQTDKDIAEAGILALSNILGSSNEANISNSTVESCMEHVLMAISSSSGAVVTAGCFLIEEAAKRALLEGILFTSNLIDSNPGSQSAISSSASPIPRTSPNNVSTLKTSANATGTTSAIRKRTTSVSGCARRYTHHHAAQQQQSTLRYQQDDLKTSPITCTTAPPSAVRLIREMLKALTTHISAELVQHSLLKALTAVESIKNPCIRDTIRELGGITQITKTLTEHTQSPGVQEYGLLALEGAMGDSIPEPVGCFTTRDFIEYVIGTMSRIPESPGVQVAGCKVLVCLARGNGTNQNRIVAAGGLDAVTAALRRHSTEQKVQSAGCTVIGYLTETNRASQDAAARCGAVEAALEALRTCGQDNAKVQESAFFALGSATVNNTDIVLGLCNAGGVEIMVTALGAHSGVERVQHNGCYTLFNMLCNTDCISRLCACGGIAAAIRAMYTHQECREIQELGCCILGSIAKDPSCGPHGVSEIMVDGGIEAIIHAMKRYSTTFKINNLGLIALTYIVNAAEVELPSTTAPLAAPSPSVPHKHSNNDHNQQLALSMLSSQPTTPLTTTSSPAPASPTKIRGKSESAGTTRADEALRRIEECGGIEVVMATAKMYRDIPQLQDHGLALLTKIAEHNGGLCAQQILTRHDARDAFGSIIGSFTEYLSAESAVQSMCIIIGIIAKNARDQCSINEAAIVARSLEGVTAAMERYPQNVSIQRNALCALAYISSWSLSFRERVRTYGGIGHVFSAMEAYPADQRLQTYGIQTFAGMAARCPQNRSIIGTNGGLFRIAAAMALHAGNEGLQRASCLAISCLLVDSPKNRTLARTSGCVERLVSAMLAFPDSERLQMLASAALVPLLIPVVDSERKKKGGVGQQKAKKSENGGNAGLMKSLRYFSTNKEGDAGTNGDNGDSAHDGGSNANGDSDDDSSDNSDNCCGDKESSPRNATKDNEKDDMSSEAMRMKQEKWLCNSVPGERAALAAMTRFPGSQVVQEAGCMILSVLPQAGDGSRDPDRVDAVLGAIREHGSACKRIRSCGCAALVAVMARFTGCAERICGVPGGIPALVDILKTPRTSSFTLTNVCVILAGVLHDVYTSHPEVRKCGGIHATVKAMEKLHKNNTLQRAGCKAISAFTGPPPQTPSENAYSATAGDEDISCIVTSGGIAALLHTMAGYPGDTDIQRLGCKTIARIAGSGKGLSGKLCDDATDLVAAAAGRHTQSAGLQKWACIALLRLCQLPGGSASVHRRMAEGMGISVVIAALRRTPGDVAIQTWGALALGAAAHGDRECQRRINTEGGIECIVSALRDLGSDAGAQRAGCLALAYIAANNSETQRKVGQNGGVAAIVSAMERYPENEDVQRYGCLALGYAALSNKENQVLVANVQRGVENVVEAMTRFPEAKDVQVNGCFALIATAVHTDLQRRAAAAGGAAAIVAALARFPNVKHLQDSGVLGLLRLGTTDPVLQRRAERVVAPECVASTLSKFTDSEAAREWCVHTLANIVRSGRPFLTRTESILDILVSIIAHQGQTSDPTILLDACALLGHMSHGGAVEITTRIRSAKGIEALLGLIAHPPSLKGPPPKAEPKSTAIVTTQELLREAFFALSFIVKEPGGANAARFVAAHGIDITVQALTRYTDDDELQSNACATLGNIAKENEDFQRRVSERGGVDAIANTMVLFPDGMILQSRCCKALGAITLNCAEAQNAACKHKCIELVTDFLGHTTSLSGRENACYAIRCLTVGNRTTQTHLIACNGHESVIKAINSSIYEISEDPQMELSIQAVLKNGLMMLMDITQVTKIAQKRVEEEISPRALLAFMDGDFGSQEIRLWCLRLLACVFGAMTPERWKTVDIAAALKTIITVMDANITVEQMQHYGCFALATIFRGRVTPSLIKCAYEVGALETTIAAMRHYPDNMKIQNNALFSLDVLTSAAAAQAACKNRGDTKLNINAVVLGPSGCLDATVDAMKKFTDFAQIQMLGANVIANAGRSTRYNKFVLRVAGCIPVLVKTLERYRTDNVICKSVCAALASLVTDSLPDQHEVAECKGVEGVLTVLAQYTDNRDILLACTEFFGSLTVPEALGVLLPRSDKDNISLSNSARKKGADNSGNTSAPSNGIQTITELIIRYTNDTEIQRGALSALANAAETLLPARTAISTCGGVGAAIMAMHKFPEDAQIQSSGCRILRFTTMTFLEEEISEAFEVIAAAAAAHTEDLTVQASAMLAFKALIDNGAAPDTKLHDSIMKTSVKVLPKFPESGAVQEGGFAVLSTLMVASPNPEGDVAHLCDFGMLELAVDAMKRFPDSLGVQEEACSLLAELAGERPHDDPRALCECVVTSMLKYPNSARLQCLGCAVFASLPAVIVVAAVDVAVDALQRHIIDEDVVLNACLVLELAGSADEAIKSRLCELCTVENIIAAMREHSINKDVQSAACAALRALPPSLGVRIALNDGCNVVTAAMACFPDEEQLLRDGIRALANATMEVDMAECLVLQSYGGKIPESPIIAVLKAHPWSESLNSEAFALLAKVIHNTENIRRIIGSVSAFVDAVGVPALKRYAQNGNIIRAILDVMAVVAEDLSGARTFAGIGGLALVQAVATAHPTDLTVQELCATIIARTIASDGLYKRFATKEFKVSAELIAERLKTDDARAAVAGDLLTVLHRDKDRINIVPASPGGCTAQRLFRCVTCSIVRGSCVNLCPECQRDHHSPSHRVMELFYPAACTCCARLNCTQHAQREGSTEIENDDMHKDYSTAVLSQRIDSLLDTLPPLYYHSLGDSLMAAGFKDTGALLEAAREKLRREVVDNTVLGLSAENALTIYVCTHNATFLDGDDYVSTTPIAVVNKALYERTPNALYCVQYLLLHLLTAVRRLPRVDENSTLYRVVEVPAHTEQSQFTYTSLSTYIFSPSQPLFGAGTNAGPTAATGKKRDELFQWPCLTSAFTNEADALALAEGIGKNALVYEIHGPITAYSVGALTGRKSEVLIEVETRFEVVKQSRPEKVGFPEEDLQAPADLEASGPARMCIKGVADPSGSGLPVAARLNMFADVIANFSPLRGTIVSVTYPTDKETSEPAFTKAFSVLSNGFYATANQAMQAAGFKHLFEEMHERYMMYVVDSPESRAFMHEWDITEEDAAIIFSFTHNNGTENSPYTVVGRRLQDTDQQVPSSTDNSLEGIHVTIHEQSQSGSDVPIAGGSIKYDRIMTGSPLKNTKKHSASLSGQMFGQLEDFDITKQPKKTLTLRSVKTNPASASLPSLPQMKSRSKAPSLQGYVLRLLMALRKLPRYNESESIFLPAEGDNLDMSKFLPGRTVVWEPLMMAVASKNEAIYILNFCKTKKPVLFEIRGDFYGYNVSRLSSSPSITGK